VEFVRTDRQETVAADGGVVVMHVDTEVTYSLNSVGAWVWEELAAPVGIDRLVGALLVTALIGSTLAFGGAIWWSRPALSARPPAPAASLRSLHRPRLTSSTCQQNPSWLFIDEP